MEKIAVITDTASDLSDEMLNRYNIKILPFRIIYKDREYKDRFEIKPQQVYDNFVNEIPTTSLPSVDDMEKLYRRLEEEGHTPAIAIVLSTGLSGIYNGLKVVSEEHPEVKTFIFDSKSISMGEGAQVLHCAELIEEGKSFDDVVEEVPKFYNKIHLFFVVGTLTYLKKGGRIGRVSGTIGELLHIKPIISPDTDGVYIQYDKIRGRKKSIVRLKEIGMEILNKHRCKVYIMHGDCEEEAKNFYEEFSKLPNISSISFGGCISPVSGVHSGPGLVGLVLVEDDWSYVNFRRKNWY